MGNKWDNIKGIADTEEARQLKLYIAKAFKHADDNPTLLMNIRAVYDKDAVANDVDNRFVQLCHFCLVEPMEMAELCVKYARTGSPAMTRQMEALIHKGEAEKLKRLFDA